MRSPFSRATRTAPAGTGSEPVVHGDYTQAAGEAAMEWLLARAPDLDAVFVASDLMAAGALTALRRAGRDVPGDVLVGGFRPRLGLITGFADRSGSLRGMYESTTRLRMVLFTMTLACVDDALCSG